MRYGMAIKGTVADPDGTVVPNAEVLDTVVDSLMEMLLDLGADDPAVSGTLSDMTIEVEMVVEAKTPAQAVAEAEDILSTAMFKLSFSPGGDVSRAFSEWTARREDALTPA